MNWSTLAQSVSGAATVATGAVTVSETGNDRKEVTISLPSQNAYRFYRLAAEIAP